MMSAREKALTAAIRTLSARLSRHPYRNPADKRAITRAENLLAAMPDEHPDDPDLIIEVQGGLAQPLHVKPSLAALKVAILDWDNLAVDDREQDQAKELHRLTGCMKRIDPIIS